MKTRGLLLAALVALSAVVAAVPATARLLDHITIPDPVGDGEPDITGVAVGSNASGAITFVVQLANRRELSDNEYVFVLVDSDQNASTGEPPYGVDFLLQLEKGGASVFRWDGVDFVDAQSRTVYGYAFNGFRLSVNKADLGVSTGPIRFWVESQAGERWDEAPNDAIVTYQPSTNPIRLSIAQFAFQPKTVAVGKRFVVGMQVHRSDLDELSSAGLVRCTAKYGKKAIKVTAVFPEDIAGCVGVAPKAAKGKVIKVTLTLELDGQRVSRTASIKVR